MKRDTRTKWLCICFAVVIIFATSIFPVPLGLTRQGMQALGIMIAGLILWVFEVMNIAVSAITLCTLLVFLNVMKPADMFKGFGGSVFFFMVGTMSITTALASTTIPTRIAGGILKWSRKNPMKLVVGFGVGTAILSSIMSNIPTCALFASLGIAIMKADGDPKPGTSNLGKALMIVIPAGSVIGGFMTPAGGPTNIVAMNYLEEIGRPITFLNWMIIGYPIGLICIILFGIFISLFYKSEPISDNAILKAEEMISGSGPLTKREKKALVVVVLMFVAWVASTWFPIFNTTCVALFGTCLFMFPGIEVLTWQDYSEKGGWDATFMVGGVGAIADAALVTGAAKWLIDSAFSGVDSWSPFMVYLVISALICIIHIIIPSGPAVAALAVAPIVTLALSANVNPVAAAMIVSYWSAITFVLPTDAVPLFTYKFGYYSMPDMIKEGWIPSVVYILFVAVSIPFAVGVLGI